MTSVVFHHHKAGEVQIFKEVSSKNEIFSLMRSCRICVDGNIGAGKTTFVRSLQKYLKKNGVGCQTAEEDMSNKMKVLRLFLDDQKKYAFSFQLMMASERINIYKASVPSAGKTTIIDRSLIGDYAFASYHHDIGNISDQEWDAYKEMIQKYSDKDFFRVPEYYIYLKVSPQVAYSRIQDRNRDGEVNGYDYQYLANISASHEKSFQEIGVDYIEVKWDEKTEVTDGCVSEQTVEAVFQKILETRLEHLIK